MDLAVGRTNCELWPAGWLMICARTLAQIGRIGSGRAVEQLVCFTQRQAELFEATCGSQIGPQIAAADGAV